MDNDNNRLTIGFLVDFFCEGYQAEILNGVVAEAEDQGINLLCYTGGELDSLKSHHVPRNEIFKLVDKNSIDGLIILGGTIGNYVDMDKLKAFYEQYEPLPIVSIGAHIPGNSRIPGILIDNAAGMWEAIEHLIRDHQFRRLAFIKGTDKNPEAELRYNVYRELLDKYNIPFDSRLVTPGDFYIGSGKKAVSLLLDERDVKFDVLIGSNDLMALEACKELQIRGIKVPYDVAVIGFDDIEECQYNKPPLTTVQQPLFKMGRLAVETVLSLMKGEKVQDTIYLNAKLKIRRSCGCVINQNRQFITLFPPQFNNGEPLAERLSRPEVFDPLVQRVGQSIKVLSKKLNEEADVWALELLTGLRNDIAMLNAYAFLSIFDKLIALSVSNYGVDCEAWDQIISSIVMELNSYLVTREEVEFLNDIANRAMEVVRENQRAQQFVFMQKSTEKSRKLHIISIELLNTFSLNKLKNVLLKELPDLGIRRCFIVEYLGRGEGKRARILLAYNEDMDMGFLPANREFPPDKLLPEYLNFSGSRNTYIIMALYFKNEQLGYILFNYTPIEGIIYETLVVQISGALKGANLIEKVQDHATELQYKNEDLERKQKELSNHVTQLSEAMGGFINTLISTVEVRDPYTAGHLRRVSDLACAIAREMTLEPDKIESIRMAASIHDLGKIYVPAEILNRPGKLTDLEFDMIKTHPQVAYNILKNIKFPWPIADIIYQHHEHYNGSGYPQGLKEEGILLEARIICVADVVEAIVSHRPYRSALGEQYALQEIEKQAGVLYDPEVVKVCLKIFKEKNYKLP